MRSSHIFHCVLEWNSQRLNKKFKHPNDQPSLFFFFLTLKTRYYLAAAETVMTQLYHRVGLEGSGFQHTCWLPCVEHGFFIRREGYRDLLGLIQSKRNLCLLESNPQLASGQHVSAFSFIKTRTENVSGRLIL